MADAGLFVGWGGPVRGREDKSLDVFGEAIAYYQGCQDAGEIESYETVLLGPHGGGLAGFFLLRGSSEQCSALRESDEFQRLLTRAGLIVEDLGVLPATVGSGVGDQIGVYQEAIGALA